ncbi:transcriptional regulator [Paenibacillus sp. BIHB 4019]|uniref:Transcriptional regulator n=1 Tax=Paenibacillus sp. BIHB 4019 TaxID=1870819 RepID=A0A1B2DRV5_9BACL|nr:helix-turn-helix transcriptional regulator [Paenibacillus sp. BIHB 4019]ANY70438.1 transcriptional regulator [Paenibacillus sp. BIHB 4019]
MLGFGAVLHACRERAGLSQEKLAELLNRSRSCISKFEKGHKLADMQTFLTWLDKTNAKDVGYALVGGTDPVTILQTILQVSGAA